MHLAGGDSAASGSVVAASPSHPGVELRADLKSISHECRLFEVAFVLELTQETIDLPLGCLKGGSPLECIWRGGTALPAVGPTSPLETRKVHI